MKMNKKTLKITAIALVCANIVMGTVLAVLYKGMGNNENEAQTEIVQSTQTVEENKADLQETQIPQINLIIDEKHNDMYTYEDMEKDLDSLSKKYNGIMNLKTLTNTADGRNVYDAIVGNKDSQNQYIVTASIHAREYITTKIVMLQLIDFLNEYNNEDVLFHVIPMVNPDGVSISQFGKSGIKNEEIRNKIEEIAKSDGESTDNSYYLQQWKANANGVDLNRNFDAMWEEYEGTSHPSSDRHKGEYPGSENEAAALIKLTQENPIKKTVSYHTMGEVIYWYFGQTGDLFDKTKNMADELSYETGYITDSNYENLDPAGYKDWALSKLGIPSVTIEVGRGNNPVDEAQTDEIYNKNKNVFNIISKP